MSSGITWSDKQLFKNLDAAPAKFERTMVAFTEFWRPQVEGYARDNAPWTDRTGNARQGLAALTEHTNDSHSIVVFHRMPYGIWLEVRWSGRYAIINPTIQVMGRQVMSSLRTLLGRMG